MIYYSRPSAPRRPDGNAAQEAARDRDAERAALAAKLRYQRTPILEAIGQAVNLRIGKGALRLEQLAHLAQLLDEAADALENAAA